MSCSSPSGSEDDDEGIDSYRKGGYHAVRVGNQFSGGRFVLAQRKIGWGQFSIVWLAYDTRSSKYVALKIQKSAALHEIELLSCAGQLIDHFKHVGPNGQHQCMVLEFLGDSLLRLIRHNQICKCILTGLDYLHRELGIIHTDLKPENILLFSTIDPAKDPITSGLTPILERPEDNLNGGSTMNLIEKKLERRAKRAVAKIPGRRDSTGGAMQKSDYGNAACCVFKQFAKEIQTRQYRAPEVILRFGYSFSVDMWSFACTTFELATGDMLFAPMDGQGNSEDEDHLALMMPRKIAIGGALSRDYFDRHGDLKRIRRLKFWPLDRLLVEKFKFPETDAQAQEIAEFLCPLFDFYTREPTHCSAVPMARYQKVTE
ncbi:SRSF protein [Salix suchowensis]|nr:SRSF protein [Salix suchowensis]